MPFKSKLKVQTYAAAQPAIILNFPALVSTTKLKIYCGHLIENSPWLMQLPSQRSLNMYNKKMSSLISHSRLFRIISQVVSVKTSIAGEINYYSLLITHYSLGILLAQNCGCHGEPCTVCIVPYLPYCRSF